ncbi:MAG: hypothetical protein QNJ81_02170 [Acidimicrobiia bacterium]|nr:hypothetical protein [Acidimicrobiia bacterium]
MLSKTLKQGDKVLALLQEQFPSYHPLIGVAKIAHSTDDERLEFDCHKVLSEFVEPKLKSVEVSQHRPGDEELKVIFEGDFEEIPPAPDTPALESQGQEVLPVDEVLMNLELGEAKVG